MKHRVSTVKVGLLAVISLSALIFVLICLRGRGIQAGEPFEVYFQDVDGMREAAPANQKHIQRYLSDNCFGDFLTRGGLDVKMRELLTFSMLVSLGGCESQVKGHIAGNANIGNDKATLLAVVTQLLPYIGYPRTLNGIACLNEVLPEK